MSRPFGWLSVVAMCVLSQSVTVSAATVTETRSVSPFVRIHLMGSGTPVLTQGGEASVIVEADEELIGDVETSVRGDVLRLEVDRDFLRRPLHASSGIVYRVTARTLQAIEVSGAGVVDADEIEVDSLAIRLNGSATAGFDRLTARELDVGIGGSGKLTLAGTVQRQGLELAGSGEYHAAKLESDDSDIRISGSGRAEVHANDSLTVVVRGSGDVEYVGNPSTRIEISGAGRVRRLTDD